MRFELAKEIKVAVIGKWKGHHAGQFEIDQTDLEQMVDNFKHSGLSIPIDYEHESLENKKAPAIGWVDKLYIKDNALYALPKWNDEARELIKNKQYKYISPVFVFNSKDAVSGKGIGTTLQSIALTNTPFLAELGEISLKNLIKNHNKGENMELEELQKAKTELEAKLNELQSTNAELVKENEELKTKVAELEAKISELEGENAEELVENSIKQGLVANSQKPWALNYAKSNRAGFKEYLNTLSKADITKQNNTYANSNKPKPKKDLAKMIAGVKDE